MSGKQAMRDLHDCDANIATRIKDNLYFLLNQINVYLQTIRKRSHDSR